MRYLCTNCNYIFDEGLWDRDSEIDAGTSFESLGDYYHCPVCDEGAEAFHEIKEEVNYIDGPHTRDPLEIDHYIEAEVKNGKLRVAIGNEIHPMGDSHSITSIALYDEYWDLVEEKFLPMDEEPVVEFDFDDLWEYEVRCQCSLHGAWGKKFQE